MPGKEKLYLYNNIFDTGQNVLNYILYYPLWFKRTHKFEKISGIPTITDGHHDIHVPYMLDNFNLDSIFLDIGANFGKYCIPMALAGYTTLAFEPVKTHLRCLEKSKIKNKIKNLIIEPYALFHRSSSKPMYIPSFTDTATLVKMRVESNKSLFLNGDCLLEESVTTIRFDDYVKNNDIINFNQIKLVKIDVEGVEFEVLSGMYNFLEKSKNIHLIIENDGTLLNDGKDTPTITPKDKIEKILLELGFKDISGTIEYNGEFIFTGSDQLWIK